MRVSVLICTAHILTGITQAYVTKQASDWTFKTVRRRVDSSNIFQRTRARSLIGCVSFCSSIDNDVTEPSLYYEEDTELCTCNSVTNETSDDENQPEIVYGIRKKVEITDRVHKKTIVWPYKYDCASLFEDSYNKDGVYTIHPPGGAVTDTWCDMTNGGWTVIQRRMDGSEDFYRGWNDYVNGFGNRRSEYWIGLDTLHRLTKNGSELVVYMEAYPGVQPSSMTAHYFNFTIGDIESNYTLGISGFNGTCGNSLAYHNGQQFTTFDVDNDRKVSTNCAIKYIGAWWYNGCHRSNLNGKYYQMNEYSEPEQAIRSTGVHWNACWKMEQSSKFVIMRIWRRQEKAQN